MSERVGQSKGGWGQEWNKKEAGGGVVGARWPRIGSSIL